MFTSRNDLQVQRNQPQFVVCSLCRAWMTSTEATRHLLWGLRCVFHSQCVIYGIIGLVWVCVLKNGLYGGDNQDGWSFSFDHICRLWWRSSSVLMSPRTCHSSTQVWAGVTNQTSDSTNWTFVTYFVKLCTHMSPRMSPTMFKHREIQRFTQANCSLLSHLSL